jgi:hypothetical protein
MNKPENKPKNVTDYPLLSRAMKQPAKWEMWCPKCGERVNVQKLLEADAHWDATSLRYLSCPHCLSQMVPKPTRFNVKDFLFLTWQVIQGYIKR